MSESVSGPKARERQIVKLPDVKNVRELSAGYPVYPVRVGLNLYELKKIYG